MLSLDTYEGDFNFVASKAFFVRLVSFHRVIVSLPE